MKLRLMTFLPGAEHACRVGGVDVGQHPPLVNMVNTGAMQPPKGLFASLHSYVQVTPPNLAPFAEKLERIVPAAVDKAIYEIMAPVVERSVTIACCTAKELVCKVRCALVINVLWLLLSPAAFTCTGVVARSHRSVPSGFQCRS